MGMILTTEPSPGMALQVGHTNKILGYIYGWLSKCWFLNSAILPQLLAARLIIIMWAYHTFSLANFKIKCVLRSRRSSAGSLFSPRCSHWCYCGHYCYLHCCPCSPHLVHIVPIFILHCSAGSFAGWLSWAGLLDCLACGGSVLDCCGYLRAPDSISASAKLARC